MPRLKLYLLGPPRVEVDGTPLELKRRKALALLLYLAGTGEAQQRDSLATLLWPNSGQRAARQALTRRVSELNKLLGPDWLETDREQVGLCQDTDLWLDMAQFEQKLADCQSHDHADDAICPDCLAPLTEAVALYRDDFLTGFTLPGCSDFDEWQFFQAEGLRQTLAAVLERLIQAQVAYGTIEAAIPHARHWLALDPLHELAHRQLMLLYAQTNQQAAALRQYQVCVETLENELGITPNEATTALYERIRSGQVTPDDDFNATVTPAREPARLIAERFEIADLESALLGQGGMGAVYLGRDRQTDETVAIKILKPDLAAHSAEIVARFNREGAALRQLNHPHIVRLLTAITENNQHYLIMEYIGGGSLADRLKKEGALPIDQVLEMALDLADALTRAHRLNIIHRDLKPANILLTANGIPKLADFGVARVVDSPRLTQTGLLMGTIDYLSPEACNGAAPTAQADIWALGVTLYELLTGKRPFSHDSITATLAAILTQPVPDLTSLRPDIPARLIDLINRMLAKDPAQRMTTVRLVGVELEAILRGQGATEQTRIEGTWIPTSPLLSHPTPSHQHNLPTPLTSLIGREEEVETVRTYLRQNEVRLLTLTGAPGIGKTRLSLQVATEVSANMRDGVCFVPLAPISDPSFVITAIARAFAIKELGERPLVERVKGYLRDRQLLLVLDNFEHVMPAAPAVAELLEAAPQLKVLVTSRALLQLYGEHEFVMSPLALPDLDQLPSPTELPQYAAVELFVQRARAAKLDFVLSKTNAPAVAKICTHLDGLPLAIELAAARSKTLSPETILARLTDDQTARLGLLSGRAPNLPPRQQTLRNAIAWSYDLLSPAEQEMFRHLGVFAGGCTLAAVQAVMSDELSAISDQSSATENDRLLQMVQSLVDKSLLIRQEVADEARFTMLEMIRAYALEQLELEGEADEARRAHATYFLHLAEIYKTKLAAGTDEDAEVWSRAELEMDNLRTALRWATTHDPELALRLTVAMVNFWSSKRYLSEGRQWLEQLLPRLKATRFQFQPQQKTDYAQLLNMLAFLTWQQGDNALAQARWEESVLLWRELQDRQELGNALQFLALTFFARGDYKAARPPAEESVMILRRIGQSWHLAISLSTLGCITLAKGDHRTAHALHEESLAIMQKMGNIGGASLGLLNLGRVFFTQGDDRRARAYLEEALQYYRGADELWFVAQTLLELGKALWRQGDKAQATALWDESLLLSRELGTQQFLCEALNMLGLAAQEEGDPRRAKALFSESLMIFQTAANKADLAYALSGLAGLLEQPERAAQLLGAAARLLETAAMPMDALERAHHERTVVAVRAQLDQAIFTEAWIQGQAMSLEEAVTWALADGH